MGCIYVSRSNYLVAGGVKVGTLYDDLKVYRTKLGYSAVLPLLILGAETQSREG